MEPLLIYGNTVYKKCRTSDQSELRDKCLELLKSTHSIRPDIILSNGLPTTEHKRRVQELTNQFKQIDL